MIVKRPPRRKPEQDEPYVEEATTLADEFVENAPVKVDEAVDELDFSIDSIRVLDRACRFQRKGFDDRYILCAGFYFGEMLRRAYKGRYRWDEKTSALALDMEGLSVFPIEKVRKVVSGQDNANMQEFLLVLAKRIADRRGYGKGGAKAPAAKPPAAPTPAAPTPAAPTPAAPTPAAPTPAAPTLEAPPPEAPAPPAPSGRNAPSGPAAPPPSK